LQAFRHHNDGIIDFSYKHFLASSVHRHALQAAEAAECARAQGHFWPMHNLLIANQDRLDLRSLYDYADSLGLDMTRFNAEMDEEKHIPTIRSHTYSGTLAGVRRTPAYLVDGVLVDTLGGLRSLFEDTSHLLQERRGAGLLTE
jgi:protein-disulfide isomerase